MRTASSIATAPGALPLLGHLVPLLRDTLDFVRSLPEHGDLVRVDFGPFQAIMVCDPGLTRHVLLDDSTFDKGGPVYDRARELRHTLGRIIADRRASGTDRGDLLSALLAGQARLMCIM